MSYQTYIGDVTLKVKNLQRSIDFYTRVLGFTILSNDEKSVRLSTSNNSHPLLNLNEIGDAITKPYRTTGLYHFAIKLPNDQALAELLINIIDHGWTIQGAADHIVSKAIYFSDSDGIGIEIYTDRAQDNWEWTESEVSMSTDRLDINALLQTASKKSSAIDILHPESIIGHIHLSVANLSDAEWFYHELIGMDITQRSYTGALFFSFDGYHHHIGVNTWVGQGVKSPPSNAVGLQSFSLVIPDISYWQNILHRLNEVNMPMINQRFDNKWTGVFVNDPSGNGIEIRVPKR